MYIMKAYIYKISIPNNDEFYIGSTTCFSRRKSQHKKSTTNKVHKKYWCKLYQFIRDNGGWCNVKMEILFEFECAYKEELRVLEQIYLDDLRPTLNSIRCSMV